MNIEQRQRPPTLEAVAVRAGVSRSTASRVISGATNVAMQTRRAVTEAVEELGYVPNRAARALATRTAGAIGLVIPEPDRPGPVTPYFASAVRSVSAKGAERGLSIQIISSGMQAPPSRQMFLGQGLAGVVVLACGSTDSFFAELDAELPVVFAGEPAIAGSFHVRADDAGGARAAARHLVERGRRRIAMLAGPVSVTATEARLAAWRDELSEPHLVVRGDLTAESGERALTPLLAVTERPDAVLVANDQMAAGVYRAVQAAGLRIPDDIAVVGFDDDDYFGAAASPALTTVNHRSAEVAATALDVLIARLQGDPAALVSTVPTDLIVRASS